MNPIMKRTISATLLLSLLLSASMTACGGSETTNPNESAPVTEPETEAVETEAIIPLPEIDYGGANYKILTAAEQWQGFYNAEQTGDSIDDAVYARNRSVEERYNIALDYVVYHGLGAGTKDVKTALTASVMGGTAEFDLMVGTVSYTTPNISDNLFMDLNQSGVDFTQPWWYRDINAELEIGGRLYVAAGGFGLQTVSNAVVTYFNKKLIGDFDLDDPYQLVKDGKWTIDKLMEMGAVVTADLDSNGKIDRADRIGLLSSFDYMMFMPNNWGHFYTTRDAEGNIFVSDATERLFDMSRRYNEIISDQVYLEGYPTFLDGTTDSDVYCDNLMKKFVADEVLFFYHKLELATKATARNKEEYGILPAPKFDETQENYITPVVNEVSGIPNVVKDVTMSAVIMDALQYYTYYDVVPVYKEIALKRKATRDEDSAEMLDIILSTMRCEFAYMFDGNIGGELRASITQKNLASYAAKNYEKFQKKIDQFVDAMKEIE